MQTNTKKNLQFWSKADSAFLAAVFVVLSLTSWGLEKAYETTATAATTQAIGTIVFKQKVAERKSSSQAIWGHVENKAPVYNFDTIRTGAGASAVVTLQDATEIHLDEDTMVGLELRSQAFSVALVTGKLAAKRANVTQSRLSIVSNGVDVAMERGSVTLARQGDNLQLQTDAPVQLTSSGQTSTVAADQSATVSGTAPAVVKSQPVNLLLPAEQAYVLGTGDTQSVLFRWQPATPGASVTLQVSATSTFSTRIKQITTDQSEVRLDLAEGSYSWRAVGQDGTPSFSRRLVVLRGSAPAGLEPLGIQTVADPQSGLVPFSWTKTPDASSYRLEIFSASAPQTPIRTLSTTLTALSVPSLTEGTYLWRVVGLYPFANSELPSPLQKFEVQKLKKLAAPLTAENPQTPGEGSKTQFSVLDKAATTLSWEAVDSAQSYQVEIARDSEFKQVVSVSTTTTNVLHRPSDLAQGDYYWRVRAVARQLVSEPSAVRSFSLVSALPLVALEPRAKVAGGQPLKFRWNDPNHGAQYKVELSKEPDFPSLVTSLPVSLSSASSGLSRTTDAPWDQPGLFYWRVKLLDPAGEALAVSSPLSFIVPGGLPAPRILAPQVGAGLDVNEVPSLSFRWTPVAGANLYRFALLRNLAGSLQSVLTSETSEATFALKQWDLLAIDAYTWKVTAVTLDQGRELQISNDGVGSFFLTENRPLHAPVVRIPKVIYLPAGSR